MGENDDNLSTLRPDGDPATWSISAAIPEPFLTILHHPTAARVGDRAALLPLLQRGAVRLSRLEPDFAAPGGKSGAPLGDRYVSRTPIRLEPHGRGLALTPGPEVELHVDGEPLTGTRIFEGAQLDRGVVIELAARVVLLLHRRVPPRADALARYGLLGESAPIERLRADIARAAALDVPVLVRGETGAGKELVARALHAASPRAGGPWLAVNVAALPPAHAAMELFGQAAGAAREQPGYFVAADGGTLFLDEVGELPVEVQSMLLCAMETGEVRPLGGGEPRRVRVRLVGATDADLESAMIRGRFRDALYYRLSGLQILVPPLRERREDIGRLLHHFVGETLAEEGRAELLDEERPQPWLSAPLVAQLCRQDWPGNVRQLHNLARQLVVSSRDLTEARMDDAVRRLIDLPAAEPPEAPVSVPLPDPAAPCLEDPQAFHDAVREALRRVDRPDLLRGSPLLALALLRGRSGAHEAQALAELLREEAERFRASPRDEHLHAALVRAYFEPAAKLSAAAQELGMGYSTLRRHLGTAQRRLSENLRLRELAARAGAPE